jgi:hypothetical protein
MGGEPVLPNRREFLAALAATSAAATTRGFAKAASSASEWSSLVPRQPSRAPNYWCTWAVQNYMYGQGQRALDTALLEGDSGGRLAHDAMSESVLLGHGGWASRFHSKVREDLYLLLDDGWQAGGTATFQLDPAKFPSFKGSSVERLRDLNREIESMGWRGAALWCRNTPGGAQDYGLESQCSDAGIRYWKIDIGDPTFNLVRTRDNARIPLTLEHVHGELPVNGDWKSNGRFGPQPSGSRRMQILAHTDVYRTYDVTSILSLPTTLDRTAELLRSAAGRPELRSLLNVEDEVYVAAVLGCTMGVMRHPLYGLRPGNDRDLFFNGRRNAKMRMDEVVRALRWQRIAEPFACGIGKFQTDAEILNDGWTFAPGETWQHELVATTVWQGAPAILARNLELPAVKASGEKPYVFAARFPNGAVAVGVQERTRPGHGWYLPPCELTLNVDDAPGPFGIFGECEHLTLRFRNAPHGKRVLAQDLAGDEPIDITALVKFEGAGVHISGRVLRDEGLRHRTPGDLSSPGVVVALV